MTHPDVVQSALGDEGVAARVDLGDDALFVTPTRTILYRADKLLSDESVEEFPHGAERVSVSTGRRKATITLDYGLDGERSFSVPAKALDRALHPVLAGTLNAVGVTDPGETVKETFRFSELTLVVTSDRLVKHIGNAVWDEEFEEFRYEDVTDLSFEEGSVATTLVLTLGGRRERFKAPNERAREVRERLTEAVLDHHGVDSVAALRERFGVDEDDAPSSRMSFGEGPTPLSVNPGELTEQPKNATRAETEQTDAEAAVDAGTEEPADAGMGEPADAAPTMATEPGATAPTDSSEGVAPADTADTVDPADSPGSGADANGSEPDSGTGEPADPDVIETSDLLGLTDDAVEEPREAANVVDDARGDDLAALTAEVEALRARIEAQNDRLDRQEELIERLIAEIRSRL
ncbi:DUF7115 domain-containing protein [Salinigranum salinum]|uniref:DUF7115 domain-containing protein n=1 Tax=Salinigranum salinum TaxID=1364937 RepID=UPI0012603F8E|nr:hypothetical protein [Salinigranum salinum]